MKNPYTDFTEKQRDIVINLVDVLKAVDGVIAIALGGSFARGKATPSSDIDIGLYYYDNMPFKVDDIRSIAQRFNDEINPVVTELGGWGKWVNGGAWLTIKGQRIDFLYRSIDTLQHWINQSKRGEFELDYYQQPATGFYSYIYLRELSICQPLYEREPIIHHLKEQVQIYPQKLKLNIIKQFSWMVEFSLDHAEKAAKRNDIYMLSGCLHRAMSAIIQIIYANNEQYFINDKGAIEECLTFNQIPENFDKLVVELLTQPTEDSIRKLRDLLKTIVI